MTSLTTKRNDVGPSHQTDVYQGDTMVGWVSHHGTSGFPFVMVGGKPWPVLTTKILTPDEAVQAIQDQLTTDPTELARSLGLEESDSTGGL